MDRIERHFTYNGTDTWTDEDGVEWNEVVKTSTNDTSSNNVDEVSEDEAWKAALEKSLFENYGVVPKYYEGLGDGFIVTRLPREKSAFAECNKNIHSFFCDYY